MSETETRFVYVVQFFGSYSSGQTGNKKQRCFLGIFQKRLDKNHEMVYNIKAD